MKQVKATFVKTFKQFLRVRAVVFWTVAWPALLLLLINVSSFNNVSASDLPVARGWLTISMITFALMMAGTSNLSASKKSLPKVVVFVTP